MKTSFLIVAAGEGSRFGGPKWKVTLAGKTLLQWNLERLFDLKHEQDELIVVVPEDDLLRIQEHLPEALSSVNIVVGGKHRIDSVRAGLAAAHGEIVVIHNVANPLAGREDFEQLLQLLRQERCVAAVGQPVVDTLRRVEGSRFQTIDRTHTWRMQTPQAFRADDLRQRLGETDQLLSDEIALFEDSELPFHMVSTSPLNVKVTYPEDLEMLEQALASEILVGLGEDSHSFDESGTIVLGGVSVDGVPKLKGNSDGDLILHALFNAISSALGKRSIGPTADPMAEQGIIDSSKYLDVILRDMLSAGYQIRNLSLSIEGSYPRIEPLVEPMKAHLSSLLGIEDQSIGITATTGEKLSSFGRGEGVRCACLVSLVRT